jgi:hypothetical protein
MRRREFIAGLGTTAARPDSRAMAKTILTRSSSAFSMSTSHGRSLTNSRTNAPVRTGVAPDKTRPIRFGRYAAKQHEKLEEGKPGDQLRAMLMGGLPS